MGGNLDLLRLASICPLQILAALAASLAASETFLP